MTHQQHNLIPSVYPFQIQWNITKICNNRCLFCYIEAGETVRNELSLESCLEFCDSLQSSRVTKVTLLGGEPLLKKGIFQIIDRLVTHHIRVTFSSNGHINDRMLQEVIRRKSFWDGIQFSLHSLDNGLHRYLTNSPVTVESILENAKVLIKAGIKLSARTVVNRLNQGELSNIHRCISRLGFTSYVLTPVIFKGRADSNKLQLELRDEDWYRQALTVGLNSLKKSGLCKVELIEKPLVADFIRESFGISVIRHGFCEGGFSYFCVAPNGDAYPCSPFYNETDYIPGNIRTKAIGAIWGSAQFEKFRRHHANLLGSTGEAFGCRDCTYFQSGQCIPCPFGSKTDCYEKIETLQRIKGAMNS